MLNTAPEVLLSGEVVPILRVSRATVYEMVRRGALPAVRAGIGPRAGLRITREALTVFLREGLAPEKSEISKTPPGREGGSACADYEAR
ncbi:MAG: helix-turn-helix domain-containing protein [Thermaerobacter sp.]|jgi:excisionase family DNA binding protein|nr:helix-turn-helix domain-containing protein [Thermaerobacter sp.]